MIEFTVNKKANSIPENFDEFSEKHWFVFMKAICSPHSQSWSDVKIHFLKRFSSIPFRILYRLSKSKDLYDKEEYLQHCSSIALLSEKLSFFEQLIEVKNNPLPVLRFGLLGLRRLFPPKADLANLKTWEMAFAVKYSKEYSVLVSANASQMLIDNALNYFIATVYRPSLPLWPILFKAGFSPFDRRRKFHDSLIPVFARRIASVPLFKKLLILYWFNSSYKNFTEMFPALFFKADSNNASDDDDDFSWADMIVSAENSMPGDEDKVANSYASMFLQRLVVNKRNLDKLKSQNKK